MTEVYKNAFTEVFTILNYLDDEDYYKIPNNIITVIEQNQNLEYQFYIDESVPFSEQKILEETKALLYILYRNYLVDDKKKKALLNIEKTKTMELENIKRKKYNPDDLFKQNKIGATEKEQKLVENSKTNYVIPVKENIIQKILKKIRKFFYK